MAGCCQHIKKGEMCVNASGLCLSKADIALRDALNLSWVLAVGHWGFNSSQPLALSKAYSFYSEGLYPFSDRIIEVVQVLWGYYSPHHPAYTMVDADLLSTPLRVPSIHPHVWLCCPWPISATQYTNQSCQTPENKSCISSYCPKIHPPLTQ